jgi:hypothetical protein
MTDSPLTGITQATAIDTGDHLYAVQGANSRRFQAGQLKGALGLDTGTPLGGLSLLDTGPGFVVQTAPDVFVKRSITTTDSGFGWANGTGQAGDPALVLANDLRALEGISQTGVMVFRRGADDWAPVTIGDGVAFDTGTGEITATATRETLQANRTYYVRTDGSDSNTGLTNNAAGAFLTIQKAVDTVATLDINGKTVRVECGAGTYSLSSQIDLPDLTGVSGLNQAELYGDTGVPANVLISTNGAYVPCIRATNPKRWKISGFKLRTLNGGDSFLVEGGNLSIGQIDFGESGDSHIFLRGYMVFHGDIFISGSANTFINAQTGRLDNSGVTIHFTAPVTFASAVVYYDYSSMLYMFSNVWDTGGNDITGRRFDGYRLSGLFVNGDTGLNRIPGSIAGRVDARSYYDISDTN